MWISVRKPDQRKTPLTFLWANKSLMNLDSMSEAVAKEAQINEYIKAQTSVLMD